MNQKYTFVCFIAVDNWKIFTRRYHLEPLCSYGKVIIVENLITFKNIFKLNNFTRFFERSRVADNIIVIKPWIFVTASMAKKWTFLRKVYFELLKYSILKYISRHSIKICMLFQPYQEFYVDEFKDFIVTFDYSDKFSLTPEFSQQKKMEIKKQETAILRNSNIVFATSFLLSRDARKLNPNVCWLTNCIDSEFGRLKTDKGRELGLGRPIIGFIGNINEWLDFDLINYLADKNQDYSFVFIGDTKTASYEFLESRSYQFSLTKKNIHFLGRKKYSDLASYIQLFDVSAIYYKTIEFFKYVHPNKLYMYLYCGKPIVITHTFPEALKLFKNMIYVAHSYEEFDFFLKKAISSNTEDLSEKRTLRAERNNNIFLCKRRMRFIERFVNRSLNK